MENTGSYEQVKSAALTFLKSHTLGTLATVSPDGDPRARAVYFACDDSFSIYFVTHADTRKWADIKEHAQAAFAVSDEKIPQTVQIEGTVTNLTNTALIDPALVDLTVVILSNTLYFAPITRFSPADMVFLKLTPNWVRWGDFSKGNGTQDVLKEIPL
ncbi:MAG: pyridoxamine 5'-phosphate oxidase family protein [Candidatus Paceibacterota bacterium]|jgi:uncharacterized pyridoxamine 5'-phosphate oxidase family protein